MNKGHKFVPQISKSLKDVWEWKEKASIALLELPPEMWADYINKKTQTIIDKINQKKTIKK